MKTRTAILLGLTAIAAPVAVGVALATPPSGLTSQLLARGAAGEFRIHEKSMGLRMDARKATDVALVGATLDPGAFHGLARTPGSVDRNRQERNRDDVRARPPQESARR